MKRFHIHVAVADVERSVRFYTALFAAEPSVVKPDYAKWMLEDPRVNFAISRRGGPLGVRHLGIQAEDEAELVEIGDRLARAEGPVLEEKATSCCYAESDKQWIADPEGIAWETFLTRGPVTVYGKGGAADALAALAPAQATICCEPALTKPAAPRCGCGPAARGA